MRKITALAAFCCLAPAIHAQSTDQTLLGVNAGWYIPTGSALRSAFGDSIFTFGVTPLSSVRPSSGSITPSFSIITANSDGSNFLLVPVTLGYEYNFGTDNTSASVIPYARVEAGVSYYQYSVFEGGPSNVSGNGRFGWVGDAELGIALNKNIKLSAKYYLFQKQSGIDFSGFELGVTYGLIRL